MLEVKDYSKQELADAIYAGNIKPESRLKKLWREITRCPELVAELRRLHYHSGDTGYTAATYVSSRRHEPLVQTIPLPP